MAGVTFGRLFAQAQIQVVAVRPDQAYPTLQFGGPLVAEFSYTPGSTVPAAASASTVSTALRYLIAAGRDAGASS